MATITMTSIRWALLACALVAMSGCSGGGAQASEPSTVTVTRPADDDSRGDGSHSADWTTTRRDDGLVVEHPEEWQVRDGGDGVTVDETDDGGTFVAARA